MLKTKRRLELERVLTVFRSNVENDLRFWAEGKVQVNVLKAASPAVPIDPESDISAYSYELMLEFNDAIKDWIYRVYCMDACLIEGAVRDLPEAARHYVRRLIKQREELKEVI